MRSLTALVTSAASRVVGGGEAVWVQQSSENSSKVSVKDGVDYRVERAVGVTEPHERRHQTGVDVARAVTLVRAGRVAEESCRDLLHCRSRVAPASL